jgi:hypothetical protein
MKSKAYILMQIKDLLIRNRQLTEEEADKQAEDLKDKTVYELLVLKKEYSTPVDYPDVSTTRWFRGEMRFEDQEW